MENPSPNDLGIPDRSLLAGSVTGPVVSQLRQSLYPTDTDFLIFGEWDTSVTMPYLSRSAPRVSPEEFHIICDLASIVLELSIFFSHHSLFSLPITETLLFRSLCIIYKKLSQYSVTAHADELHHHVCAVAFHIAESKHHWRYQQPEARKIFRHLAAALHHFSSRPFIVSGKQNHAPAGRDTLEGVANAFSLFESRDTNSPCLTLMDHRGYSESHLFSQKPSRTWLSRRKNILLLGKSLFIWYGKATMNNDSVLSIVAERLQLDKPEFAASVPEIRAHNMDDQLSGSNVISLWDNPKAAAAARSPASTRAPAPDLLNVAELYSAFFGTSSTDASEKGESNALLLRKMLSEHRAKEDQSVPSHDVGVHHEDILPTAELRAVFLGLRREIETRRPTRTLRSRFIEKASEAVELLHSLIEDRAREIWILRGRPEGESVDHWLEAETEVFQELQEHTAPRPVNNVRHVLINTANGRNLLR